MNTGYELIDKQILLNRGKNLFFNGTERYLDIEESFLNFIIKKDINNNEFDRLAGYAVNKVIDEMCYVNQYYNFSSKDKDDLKDIYSGLIISLKANRKNIVNILDEHAANIQSWLCKTNPFSYSVYKNKGKYPEPVICAEYSAELQLSVLGIDIKDLKNPVLDIGCGKNAYLVKYLMDKGFDCYGIDQFYSPHLHILNVNWLEYDYGEEKWGTIISNLGFSNHFIHHHLREDGNYVEYASKYMRILKSLKYNGSFYYAPDLPFIENLLDKKEYVVNKHTINDNGYSATTIKKQFTRHEELY